MAFDDEGRAVFNMAEIFRPMSSVLIPGSRDPGPFFNPEITGFEPSNPGISRLKFSLNYIE